MASKQRSATPMNVAQKLAREALDLRRKAAGSRERALAERRPERRPAGARTAAALAPARSPSAGLVIAEGDSWFDYPLHDVLKDLEDLYGYDVESVAHMGDTVEDMAYSSGQLEAFCRRIEKALRAGTKPKAILLSGGGNDIAGEAFAFLLNHAASAESGLNADIVAGVIDKRLRDAYLTILHAITILCTKVLHETVRIVVHGYDYAVPDGRGFLGGWGPLPGNVPVNQPGYSGPGLSGS